MKFLQILQNRNKYCFEKTTNRNKNPLQYFKVEMIRLVMAMVKQESGLLNNYQVRLAREFKNWPFFPFSVTKKKVDVFLHCKLRELIDKYKESDLTK